MKIGIELNNNKLEFFNNISKQFNLTIEDAILKFINDNLENIIQFEYGFYYDKISSRLYNSKSEIIKITNYEEKLLEILIENINEFVTIEDIFNCIWGREVSIFTLRNIVKKIRDKTYPKIIQNKSRLGYRIIKE
jgi:DNA-binding winged helix-turn-helix (wHTH) protein